MRYSRTGIVAVLIAVEFFLAGAILWTLRGSGGIVQAAGLHRADWNGAALAAIDAGSSPAVVIDDPDSRVSIRPSADGKVHVADNSHFVGLLVGGTPHRLTVERTADGVSIVRPPSGLHFGIIGYSQEHVDVQVPAGSSIDVRRCAGADVSGMRGGLKLHSVDGSLHLNDIDVAQIDAVSEDGAIRADGLRAAGGRLHTQDGAIRVALANADVDVRAGTHDGSIYFDGRRAGSDEDSAPAQLQVGKGGGLLDVSTQDGSIHITTNGAP